MSKKVFVSGAIHPITRVEHAGGPVTNHGWSAEVEIATESGDNETGHWWVNESHSFHHPSYITCWAWVRQLWQDCDDAREELK